MKTIILLSLAFASNHTMKLLPQWVWNVIEAIVILGVIILLGLGAED